jgi:hypothetical protein
LPCGKDRERYLLKDLQYLLNGTTHIPMLIKAAISIDIIIAIRYFHQRKWGQAQKQQLPTASSTENQVVVDGSTAKGSQAGTEGTSALKTIAWSIMMGTLMW